MHHPLSLRAIGAICLVVAAPMLASCKDRAVSVRADDAIDYDDLEVVEGEIARKGHTIEAVYRVWLRDGTVLIDLEDDRRTHTWVVGDGTVIPGMDIVVTGMRRGGVRRATIPWAAGYGSRGYGGVVPERAPLEVEVEIVDVRIGGWERARPAGR